MEIAYRGECIDGVNGFVWKVSEKGLIFAEIPHNCRRIQ